MEIRLSIPTLWTTQCSSRSPFRFKSWPPEPWPISGEIYIQSKPHSDFLAARKCINLFVLSSSPHRIPYGPHLIPAHLCQDLEMAKTCDCGRVCVSFYIKTAVSMNLHQVSHTVVLVDDMGGTDSPVEQHFCSLSCYYEFIDSSIQRAAR